MNTALILKETEKAMMIQFGCWMYEQSVTVKTWMPKSQINIVEREGGKMKFEAKNNWILDAKVKDYVKYIDSIGGNLSQEMRLYISGANSEKIEYVFA